MNKKFTKLIAALALLVFMTPSMAGWGQTKTDPEVTFSYTAYDGQGTSGSGSACSATSGDISIASTKAYCASDHVKEYSGSEITFSSAAGNINSIAVTTSSNVNNVGLVPGQPGSISVSGSIATWTGDAAEVILKNIGSGQFRWTSIKVTYAPSGGITHILTFGANPTVGGSLVVGNNLTSPATVAENDILDISATANTGYKFTHWSLSNNDSELDDPDANSTTFMMGTSDVTLTAHFAAAYNVNISNSIENGTVEADMETAIEDEIVTLTAHPNPGYHFTSFTVTKVGGGTVDVEVEDNTGMFEMPSESVTVGATFTANPSCTITFNTGTGTCETPSMSGPQGSSITLPTASPSAGCSQAGWTFAGWTDETVTETTTAPDVLLAAGEDYTITTTEILYAVYRITGSGSGTTIFNFSEIASANHWENSVAYTEVTIAPVTIEAQGGGNNGKWYTSGGGSWRMYNGGTVMISVASSNVTAVTSSPSCEFTINNNGTASYSPSARTDFTQINVTYGSSTITYNSNPLCQEQVATPTFNPASGTYTGAKRVAIGCTTDGATILYKLTEEGGWLTYNAIDSITVSQSTTIWAKATKTGMDDSEEASATYTIQYTLTDNIENVTDYYLFDYHDENWDNITPDGNGQALVSSGAQVRISGGLAEECYTLLGFYVVYGNNDTIFATYNTEDEDHYYSFIMPANNATLKAKTNQLPQHTLTIGTLSHVTLELTAGEESNEVQSGDPLCEGIHVTVIATPAEDYVMESVSVVYGDNQSVEVTPEGSNTYSFYMPTGNATITATAVEIPQPETYTYVLATSIQSGKHYIITDGINKAMGSQNTNNRAAVSITIENGEATGDDNVYEFVITTDATNSNWFNIFDGVNGGYLYAAGGTGSNNHLKVQTELTDNGRWTIVINENGVATITAQGDAARKIMRYNSSSNIFSCYASGQKDIYLYERVYTRRINAYENDNNPSGWYLIASPVTSSITPSADNGFITDDISNPNNRTYDLYYFDQTGGNNGKEWKNYRVNNFNLVNGTGYLYANKNGTTLAFTGMPYSGDGEVDLVYSDDNDDSDMWGWNLIGNPFSTAATVDKASFRVSGGNDFIATASGSRVEPMEGLFVYTAEDAVATFTQTRASRSTGNSENLILNLSRGSNELIDRAIVSFSESNVLPKFQLNPNNTKLYITQDNKDYAVVRNEAQGEMPVNFKAAEDGTYTLTVNPEGVEMNYLHLIDNMTGANIDLLQTPSYTFSATTRDYESRFRLVFAASNIANTDSEADSFAFFSNGSWIINNVGEATLQVVDINGRILSNETVNGSVSTTINVASGVYMLRLINGENVKVQKIVVR